MSIDPDTWCNALSSENTYCFNRRATYPGKYSIISHKPQVSSSLSLVVLILYLCSPPGSCHICCITLGTCHAYILLCTSSSIHKHTQNTQVLLWPLSSTGGMYTSPDVLAQSSSCTPRHTQLTYIEVPIDADTLRSTGRTPWQQAHRLAQSLPPQHPFKTDRIKHTTSPLPLVSTLVLWRHACSHPTMPL